MNPFKFLSALPPPRVRCRAWNLNNSKRPIVVKEVCILPFGGGVWLPYRNVTKQVHQAKANRDMARAYYEASVARYKAEVKRCNQEIKAVGFWADSLLKVVDGKMTMVNLSELVDLEIGEEAESIVSDSKKKKRVEVVRPAIVTSRPRQNNGGKNNNSSGNNNNSNSNQ